MVSHAVMLQTVRISPGTVIGAHVEEQQEVIIQGPFKPRQPLWNVPDLNSQLAANIPRQQVCSSDGASIPKSGELAAAVTCCFLLLHDSGSSGLLALLEIAPSPFPETRALNIICACRSAGGT